MMKKITVLIPFMLFGFNSGYVPDINQEMSGLKCDRVLNKTAFDICYSDKHKTPNAVAYEITKTMIKSKNISRKHRHFKPDLSIPKRYRAKTEDYVHEGFDRGHSASNETFNYDPIPQKETFLLSNIAPQAKWLNRIYWKKAEDFSRSLAVKYGKVEVVTGNCNSKGHIKNNVNIPAWWYKIIYIPKTHKTIAFLAPNTNKGMKTADLNDYEVKVSKIQETCNFQRSWLSQLLSFFGY